MELDRVYYIYMVQVREGQYETFRDYESKVLPLLPKHQGKLEIRLKVNKTGPNQPDEIHVISFATVGDKEAYRTDPERTRYLFLFEKAVEFATLIEGYKVL
jgi:hypothetical protein